MNTCDAKLDPFLRSYIVNNFMQLVDMPLYAHILDRDLKVVCATNSTAISLGFQSWHELQQLSYRDYKNRPLMQKVFQSEYRGANVAAIENYCKEICRLQQHALDQAQIVSYLDLLPYNNQFVVFLVTLIPLINPNQETVGLYSASTPSNIFNLSNHLPTVQATLPPVTQSQIKFSKREAEVLFLIANGIAQEHAAQILSVSRSTIAAIIANKLCPKFGIAGSNTKLLAHAAISHGYASQIPPSLWHPLVLPLTTELG